MTSTNARNIMKEILAQRFYTDVEDFEDGCIQAVKPNKQPIIVFFDDAPKLNKGAVNKYLSIMDTICITHGIIVYNDSVTAMTAKSIDQSIGMDMELFSINELQFNITKHKLQPEYFKKVKISNDLKKTFVSKLPLMKPTDPIARFFRFMKGDIIEIKNKNGIINHRRVA